MGQLIDKIRGAVHGNVGTYVIGRVGTDDVEDIVKMFQPVFQAEDLLFMPNYTAAVKLLIIPLCTIPLLMLFHLPSEISMTMLIAAACPAATTGTMMAIRFKQNYTYSSEIFAMSTVLSVVTIPLLVWAAELVL